MALGAVGVGGGWSGADLSIASLRPSLNHRVIVRRWTSADARSRRRLPRSGSPPRRFWRTGRGTVTGMGRLEEGKPPLGDQTPRQRFLVSVVAALLCVAASVLFWTDVLAKSAGAGRFGDFLMPVFAVLFSLRAVREARSM